MSFACRRLLRDHLAFDAPPRCLAYHLHGPALPPDQAEALRLQEIDDLAQQQRAGLGRFRAAFPARVELPPEGLYPAAMRVAAHFTEQEARELLQETSYELSPEALSRYQDLFRPRDDHPIAMEPQFADRTYRYRMQDYQGFAATPVPCRVVCREIFVLNLFSRKRREGEMCRHR